jgi:pimeloyl-ACP methyl ester carboxylesterase
VLAGHSADGLDILNFVQLYPDQVAGVALLDSMSPQQYTQIADWPMFYEMFLRASAVLPSLSRFGVGRVIYSTSYDDLPALARDEERVFMATPRDARSVCDEFSQIRTTMTEAQALTALGDRPLGLLTAEKDARADGWQPRTSSSRCQRTAFIARWRTPTTPRSPRIKRPPRNLARRSATS